VEPLLYSKTQAASVLNLSVRTLEGLLRRGQILHRKVGRRVLIPRQDVERFARMGSTTKGPRTAKES
jgi:excisionase family DNA binding protein